MNGALSKSPNSPDCGDEQKLLPPLSPTSIIVAPKSPNPSMRSRSRYRPGATRKLRRRAVLKSGECNVLQSKISRRSLRFLQDIFTTLVDTQWRWTLLCFTLSFLLSWLGFAVIWWLIAFTHGDFEERHLPPYQQLNNWTPCIYNIFSFTSCFLFSIETQHTIGYGGRSTTEECPEAIFVMCIQSLAGVMIQAFMVGIVFAKMSRPKQRTQTLLFSRNAVICQRDGLLCLMFRVGDMRKSHIIGAAVRAQLIRSRTTKEGEILAQHQQELVVGTDGQNGNLFFIWPTTIVHKINADSPLYNISAEDMLSERFEVVVILEGTIESTGQTTQARSSYLPQEILWGHRFEPLVSYSKERQGYEVDYSLFNSTTQVDTPLCSGRELAEFYRVQDELRHANSTMIDEDQLDCNPDIHGHYCCALRQSTLPIQQHRPLAAQIDSSVRSENSFEDTPIFRHPCRDASCTSHCAAVRRDFAHLKFGDGDPDAIQVIGDVELQQLPEAVNREIMKNSREIVYEENVRESEDCHVGGGRGSSRKSLPKHGFLDEERRSLNGSRRNLNNRSFLVACDDGRRSLNGSRRNLNNSNRRYLLVALDQSCNSSRNLHAGNADNLTATRRHTGSGERLDDIRRSVAAMKVAKETPTTTPESGKRRLNHGDVEMHNKVVIESEKVTLRHPTVEEMSGNSRESPRETNASPNATRSSRAPTSPLSDLSPESGFFEGNQSSPETARNSNFLGNLKRNRRSYEHAQLQDVNRALSRRNSSSSNSSSSGSSSSDNDGPSKNLLTDVDLSNGQILEAVSPKQTIPYTSV